MVEDTDLAESAKGYYSAYQYHSNLLRTWLVAYGIGGPVLLLTNDTLWGQLTVSGQVSFVGKLFLIGVALQIFLAALNKAIMWTLYYGEGDQQFQKKWRYEIAAWLSGKIGIDLVVDIVSMVLMAWATVTVLGIIADTTG